MYCTQKYYFLVFENQGGLHPEMRLGNNLVIFLLKSSQNQCGLIRLQIKFVLDMWVTHHCNMLYYQEISKDRHH